MKTGCPPLAPAGAQSWLWVARFSVFFEPHTWRHSLLDVVTQQVVDVVDVVDEFHACSIAAATIYQRLFISL